MWCLEDQIKFCTWIQFVCQWSCTGGCGMDDTSWQDTTSDHTWLVVSQTLQYQETLHQSPSWASWFLTILHCRCQLDWWWYWCGMTSFWSQMFLHCSHCVEFLQELQQQPRSQSCIQVVDYCHLFTICSVRYNIHVHTPWSRPWDLTNCFNDLLGLHFALLSSLGRR